jgi:hypothetical protein
MLKRNNMKRVIISFFLGFVYLIINAQVPQGLNYQAIARDGSGNPITGATLQVKVAILSDTTNNIIVWEELHSIVKTNAFGLFTLVIGTGTRQSGSALVFSDINWATASIFLNTQIYYQNSWRYLGSAKLWSVPYSMVSSGLSGPLKKLGVTGETTSPDSSLFEVKNRTGQTIFAVYNEGVRIYVDDGIAKGSTKGGFAIGGFGTGKAASQEYFVVSPDSIRAYIGTNPVKSKKGGFAIGGFDKTKAGNEEYLRVTRDSTRIYLNDTGTKAKKGGFAIGGFDKTKGNIQDFMTVSSDSVRVYIDDQLAKGRKGGFAIGGFDKTKGEGASFFNVFPDSTGKINPSQNRILWYPLKNALLAGRVLAENKDSVGENSFASGFESKARGKYSQALGYKAIARGDYSTAIGKNAVASKINSFSFGDNVHAIAQNTYAFGKNSLARGDGSYAFGYNAIASGQDSYAFGTGVEAQGMGSFAMGFIGRDSAGNATGNTLATVDYAVAIGMGAQAKAEGAYAIGVLTQATGTFSTAMGYTSRASAESSIAMGYSAKATATNATSIGTYSIASGYSSSALGSWNIASGTSATALGGWTRATGMNSTSMGYQTIASGNYSTVMGLNSVAKGHASTAIGWGTVASGFFSTATGYNTKAKPYSSFVVGQFNDTTCSDNAETSWNLADPLFICGNGPGFGTRSNAFTVYKDGNAYLQGNFGIGTTAPSAQLHVNGNAYINGNMGIGTATPVNKLDVSGGNNWDLLNGEGDFRIGNSSYRLKIGVALGGGGAGAVGIMQFGQTGGYNVLSLGAQGNFLLFLNGSSQNVGVGTGTPDYKLTVNGTAWCSSGSWTGSDVRWKRNITNLDNTLSGIMSLQAVNYDLRTEEFPQMGFESGSQIGLIAQDVEKVFPLLVNTDNKGYKAVAYDKLSVVLVEAVKEQQKQIDSVRQENRQLKSELDELKALVGSLLAGK